MSNKKKSRQKFPVVNGVITIFFRFLHVVLFFPLIVEPLNTSQDPGREHCSTPTFKNSGDKPTLHEILIADKLDFEAKVQRAARRKKWLKGQ